MLGYGSTDDHNAPDGTGVSPFAMNVRNEQRVSANDAYLEGARSRPNLTIVGDALVDHVELNGRRARGVRVLSGEQWQVVEGREVSSAQARFTRRRSCCARGLAPPRICGASE